MGGTFDRSVGVRRVFGWANSGDDYLSGSLIDLVQNFSAAKLTVACGTVGRYLVAEPRETKGKCL